MTWINSSNGFGSYGSDTSVHGFVFFHFSSGLVTHAVALVSSGLGGAESGDVHDSLFGRGVLAGLLVGEHGQAREQVVHDVEDAKRPNHSDKQTQRRSHCFLSSTLVRLVDHTVLQDQIKNKKNTSGKVKDTIDGSELLFEESGMVDDPEQLDEENETEGCLIVGVDRNDEY